MRKFFSLLLVLLVLVSGVVLAVGDNDGIKISFHYESTFNDPHGQSGPLWFDRDYNKDNSSSYDLWKQVAEVKLKAQAFIPCYLSLNVHGNLGNITVESFGPGAVAQGDSWNHGWYLLFDNEYGGFVDGAWNRIGQGKNYEQAPGPNVFIQGCDDFIVEIYSNDNYKYEVASGPLVFQTQSAHATLPLIMGTALGDTSFSDYTFDDSEGNANLAEFGPFDHCKTTILTHKFRVPYNTDIRHGEYNGAVTLRAYTI